MTASASPAPQAGGIINQSPRPRLLVRGFHDNADLVRELLTLAPTSRQITSLRQVRQDEWDILVTDEELGEKAVGFQSSIQAEQHLCIVYVGTVGNYSETIENQNSWAGLIRYSSGHISQELKRISGLPESIATLVRNQLEHVLKSREQHTYFQRFILPAASSLPIGTSEHTVTSEARRMLPPQIEPFILTADDKMLAGRYRRGEASETWLIPSDALNIASWVRVSLNEWHKLAPSRSPGMPDWSESEKWMTNEERDLVAELASLKKEREEVLERLAERESEIRTRLRDRTSQADSYERALLTTQSEDLVNATIRALRELGFKVVDVDTEAPDGDHLEDLRIHDPDTPNWIALGEVKGYTKGAKTEAIAQFIRFSMRYMERHKKAPNAMWYIVNQFLGRDPSARQPVLNGKDDDVGAFANSRGLVLDTVTLFQLLSEVREGAITHAEARRALREATGRFCLPT